MLGLADHLSSLADMNLVVCLISLNISGGLTNTTNGLNMAVLISFNFWPEETEQTCFNIVIKINSDVIPLRNILECNFI